MIHRLNDLRDLSQTIDREMHPAIHHLKDPLELEEVLVFRRAEWICFEEWNDHVAKILPSVHLIAHQVAAVIVVSSIAIDAPATKEVSNQLQDFRAAFVLHNREHWLELPSESHPYIALNRSTEAALTVNEADDPLLDS